MKKNIGNIIIKSIESINEKINFICIGTDRVIGDCVGPLVGTCLEDYLKKNNIKNFEIIGSLNKPLTANNYEKINGINGFNIIIDSALSNKYELGSIIIEENNSSLKQVLNKDKKFHSNMIIKCVVAKDFGDKSLNFINMQNISLNFIYKMSNEISKELIKVINKKLV